MYLEVVFYRMDSGAEPVRDWLRGLSRADKRTIGRKLEPDLWEIRSRLDKRIARVLFTVQGDTAILLHGFIKKSQKMAKADLALARQRKAKLEN